tara:strand:+ start:6947 stop:7345 length:399 start_codon:yes stop_codon:yes gene_type:complete
MPRSPDDRVVVRDSRTTLWCAVRDGVVASADLSPDGKLRPSLTATPAASVRCWNAATARLHAAPVFDPRDPPVALPIPAPMPGVGRLPLGDVHVNILREELRAEERKRAMAEKRERALMKVVDGLCKWKGLC